MSTLQTINGSDLPTNSRADINGNFTALNTDKMETSVLDTDTTLAANSNSRVPTQAAVKAYVDAGGNVNASTTTKGIVEEATQAEVNAGTATGGTGARLFVNPSVLPAGLTIIPQPNFPPGDGSNPPVNSTTISVNTTAYVTQVIVPFRIVVNKVSIYTGTVTGADTLDLSMYSEDGQTQIFSVTTASVASTTLYTTSVSSVSVAPGIYYIMINGNGSPNLQVYGWYANSSPFTAALLNAGVTSEPVLNGTLTITAGTPPTTFTPSSLTGSTTGCAAFRLDN